ncbi:MAG: lysophospholipid acyltransferase family protein [Acidimicrobiales bacterium]
MQFGSDQGQVMTPQIPISTSRSHLATKPTPIENPEPPRRSSKSKTTPDSVRLRHAVEKASRYPWLGRALTFPLRRAWLDIDHIGRENVPADGPVVLAANHLAFIDSPLVMFGLDRPVTFLGKAEYLDNPVARRLLPAAGMLPLDRSGSNSRVTLDRANDILGNGGVIGVHPEGTRSRDGRLSPAHNGVAQMALRAGAPVVPVALIGTDVAQPVGQIIPKFRGRVEIRFGPPIGLGRWATARRASRSRRELSGEIMEAISALSGQEQRDHSPTVAMHPA